MRFSFLLAAALAVVSSSLVSSSPLDLVLPDVNPPVIPPQEVNTPVIPPPVTTAPVITTPVTTPVTTPSTTPSNLDCDLTRSPALNDTKKAFATFKNAVQYVLGSIINAEPTHTQLSGAATWAIGNAKKSIATARALNKGDPHFFRRSFIKGELIFLDSEIFVTEELIANGLPSYPWMGKAYAWIQGEITKIKAAWHSFWDGDSTASATEVAKANTVVANTESNISALDTHIETLNSDSCPLPEKK